MCNGILGRRYFASAPGNGVSLRHLGRKRTLRMRLGGRSEKALDRYFRTRLMFVSGNTLLIVSNVRLHCKFRWA